MRPGGRGLRARAGRDPRGKYRQISWHSSRAQVDVTYPVLAIAPDGFVMQLASADALHTMPYGYLGLFRRRRATLVLFGRDGTKWRGGPGVARGPNGEWWRVVKHRRPVALGGEVSALGPYDASELREALRAAVVEDDDILCQYYSKRQILTWLDRADSVGRLFNLYNWIRKEPFKRPRRRSPASTGRRSNRQVIASHRDK